MPEKLSYRSIRLPNSILAAFEMSLYCAIPIRQSLPTAFKKTVQTPPATRADRRKARATERSCVRAPYRTPWPTGGGLFPPDLGGIDFAGVIAFAECYGLGPPQSHRNFWFFFTAKGLRCCRSKYACNPCAALWGDGGVATLERDITFTELRASLAGYRERVFRSRSESWSLVAGSRGALAHSQQLIAEVEASLARGGGRSPAQAKLRGQLDFAQEANRCFRLAECETHAGIGTILMGMGYGWLSLAFQHRQP